MNEIQYKLIVSAFIENGYCFDKFNNSIFSQKKHVLLRHDIDFSVESALKIAKLEIELGVRSTFFFMINSNFYNIFSERSYRQIAEIATLGHVIAFHLDQKYCEILNFAQLTHSTFCKWLHFANKEIISIHRPGSLYPHHELPQDCVSVYDDLFTKKMKYFSDSGCKWRENPLKSEEFKSGKNIQLLLHPIWWVYEGKNATEKFESFLVENQAILKQEIQNNFSERIVWSEN